MTARIWVAALGGVLLMAAFAWYRGDLGVVDLGPLGAHPPPSTPVVEDPDAWMDRLRAEDSALGGELLARDPRTARPAAYASHELLVKPLAPPPESETDRIDALFAAAGAPIDAAETPDTIAAATAAAEAVGVVRPAGGGAWVLQVTAYGLDSPPAGDAAAPWPAQARLLAGSPPACDAPVDEERAAADPAYALSCVIAQLNATGAFAWVERNRLASATSLFGPPSLGGPAPVSAAPDRPDTGVAAGPGSSATSVAASARSAPADAAVAADASANPEERDPLARLQWHFGDGTAGGAAFTSYWARQGRRADGVVVAVLDSGVDNTHPDVPASGALSGGADFVSTSFFAGDGDGRDSDPRDPARPCHPGRSDPRLGQGAHVAGLIGAAASGDGAGLTGAAQGLTITPVRVGGRCGALQSDLNDALRWAAGVEPTILTGPDGASLVKYNPAPAQIIVVAISTPAPQGCPASTQDAVDAARAAGAVIVAAAGDDGVDARGASPGACAGVLTVAAGDAAGRLTASSNYGPRIDILAPGGDLTADLDGDDRPDGVLSTRRASGCRTVRDGAPAGECLYSYGAGTALAAAHVGGALALLAAQHRDASREELVSLIVDTARDPRTPAQCPRPCGSGLLDMARAAPGYGDLNPNGDEPLR